MPTRAGSLILVLLDLSGEPQVVLGSGPGPAAPPAPPVDVEREA